MNSKKMESRHSAATGTAPKRSAFMMIGFLGVLLCSIPFYVSVVPPMTDVSQHVLVARIIAEYENPAFRFADYFTIDWAVAPNTLFYALLVPLQQFVGPFWDARIYMTIWVAATWVAVWYLAKVRNQEDPWIAALMALPITFCWYAYKGFLPFLMTFPLFSIAIAIWFGDLRPMRKIPVLWLLLVALFGFHIVGAAAAAAAICIAASAEVFVKNGDRHQLAFAALAVVPVPILTAIYLLGDSAPSSTIVHAGLVSNIVDVVKFTIVTLDNWATALMLLWLILLGSVLLVGRSHMSGEGPVLLGSAGLVVLAIAMPASLGSLWPAGPRLLPFALILLIVCLPWARLPKRLVGGAGLAIVLGLSAFTVRHVVALDRGLNDFIGGAHVVEPGSSILPILATTYDDSLGVNPYWALISVYTVMVGGSNPYVLATPHVMTGAAPLRYRRASDREYAFLYDLTHTAEDYAGVSASYDYVLLWGQARNIARVLEREMDRVYVSGDATLFASRRATHEHDGL